jgi:hypothetical protein
MIMKREVPPSVVHQVVQDKHEFRNLDLQLKMRIRRLMEMVLLRL